ncbi:helix-turn-helix domain-containing protein [Nocardia cyriacigeorgica]|uniref:helix-turn-helix domain-containing protein n=1 Tax=Nocardia cyriacigeorgica TaxID=135487 RepID=UPI0018933AE4|nr:helix-turn-helix transcriptional regulator [Nocardia cyriacigeorgica]MBF6435339.1 helix-turn-helix domain-containing protein [Nocardia cyriacigeorgica]MBF6454581.1 helix-turn-helix domain-containing protein [Nocardia cyriacigeorgica]MBF6481258.1 helix-turn-helix domain-containing protein [Nocardia cyriacigeorgica]MBF6552475.1 helix-turn-helix domain-containing protein [Nocardia cyriacigeorgica]
MAAGSTLPQRAAGRELRRLRMRAGKSQTAAGKAIEVSPQTIGRMEDGLPTKLSRVYVNALCDEYGATQREREQLLILAAEVEEAKKAGKTWWRSYAVEPGFNHYLALEDAASRVTSFQMTLVPGLFQTPEYRRELIWADDPTLSTNDAEQKLELAMRRQAKLNQDGFGMNAILSEAVLRHRVGGPSVMAGQLHRLAEVGGMPNISVRVIPFRAVGHIGLQTVSFSLLEFPPMPSSRMLVPPVAYFESYTGHLFLEQEAEIQRYKDAWARLVRVASDEQDTRSLILEIAKEFENEQH